RPDLPVFVASGFAGETTPGRMSEAGIAGFPQKPIDPSELARALARALQ
ncbi:MAG: hypothetical protein FD161_4957, partial [Limisphaerales bacterium]